MLLAECDQCGTIGLRQRTQVTERQRHGVVTCGDLDLCDLRARLEPSDQGTQIGESLADFGKQGVAVREIGDEARILLAESDQHLVLLGDPFHRQAALAAISPRVTGQGFEPALRLDLADALEILRQHMLFGGDLRLGRKMLQAAAAAGAEMRTARFDPLRRADDDLFRLRLVVVAVALHAAETHAFARQGAADENGLAFDAGNAAAVVGKVGDVDFDALHGIRKAKAPAGEAGAGVSGISAERWLLLLPGSARVLIIPAWTRLLDPLLGERLANLLLPFRMPGMDGCEVLAHLRARPGPSRGAIALATTAANDADTIAALHAAGFVETLLKPIAADALRAAVARHLGTASAALTGADDLDDEQAHRAAGGDAAIVASLRGLFAAELEALPAQIAGFGVRNDMAALRERLHRLEASAGFCGAPTLTRAIAAVRTALESPLWPTAAVATLLEVSERTRQRLSG